MIKTKVNFKVQDNFNEGGIWIWGEIRDEHINEVVFQLMSQSRCISPDSKLGVIILGENFSNERKKSLEEEFSLYGVNSIILCENPIFLRFNETIYSNVLKNIIRLIKPDVFLFGATACGCAIASKIAVQLHVGLTANCIKLSFDNKTKKLIQTRPAYGGRILADIVTLNSSMQMATVKPNVFPIHYAENRSKCFCRTLKAKIEHSEISLCTVKREDTENVSNCTLYDTIIGIGMGVDPNLYELIFRIAKHINAGVSITRAVAESGRIKNFFYVGQTGQSISPKIYLALGISGAIQHISGVSKNSVIIAINNNQFADIFNYADYGIVNDCRNIMESIAKSLFINK